MLDFYGVPYRNDVSAVDAADRQRRMLAIFEFMKPKPSPFELVRIGGDQDGAYLLPDDLDGIEACFSPGVNNRKNFEDELAKKFNIRSHMCDYSSSVENLRTPLIDGMQTFKRLWLDVPGSENSIDIKTWIDELAPDKSADLMLQIDIEGAEFRNIISCDSGSLGRFRIIVMELHALWVINNFAILQGVLEPFFAKLAEQFTCVHAHPNNCAGVIQIAGTNVTVPATIEITLLRKDRFKEGCRYPPMLPHPLDIKRNVPENPPLPLSDCWSDGPRTTESRLKLLDDRVNYLEYQAVRLQAQNERTVELAVKNALRAASTSQISAGANSGSPVAPSSLTDIARGKKYVISSAYMGFENSGLIGAGNVNYFFHTRSGVDESIEIDLEADHKVRCISITNRLDACRDRARLLFVTLRASEANARENVYLFNGGDEFIHGKTPKASLWLPDISCRYVKISSPFNTALHFSAIEVFEVRTVPVG
jgi:hypothetical protein